MMVRSFTGVETCVFERRFAGIGIGFQQTLPSR
jgi:hypothetical protein